MAALGGGRRGTGEAMAKRRGVSFQGEGEFLKLIEVTGAQVGESTDHRRTEHSKWGAAWRVTSPHG